jgi:UDP-4-amino-4,6-dideoxy-N-acetyl-beta-L-altrosamine N-acetyltransferase
MFELAEAKLRPLEYGDLRQILTWRNSERIRKSMFTTHLITWEEHLAWFARLQHRDDQAMLLFIYRGVSMGVINFTTDLVNHCCEWGFYIGDEAAPPRSGTVMGLLGLNYAFDQLAMDIVRGQCYVTNMASVRYHKKLGFSFIKQLELSLDGQDVCHLVKLFELKKEIWAIRRLKLYPQIFSDYEKVLVKP